MFPNVYRKIGEQQESISVNYLLEKFELILDKNKCVGCGICSRVCPKEAISRGPIGASKRFPTQQDLIPNLYDPKKCVYCGTCVYLCPFGALTLKKNGKIIESQEIPIVNEKAVPKLRFRTKKLETGRSIKPYLNGKITLDTNKCPGGCSTCVDICPSKAIELASKPKNGWEISEKIHLDPEKCVFCGACNNACPVGAIKLEITEIKTSGEYLEPFWPNIVKKLKNLNWHKKRRD